MATPNASANHWCLVKGIIETRHGIEVQGKEVEVGEGKGKGKGEEVQERRIVQKKSKFIATAPATRAT